jgi:DNA-binding IclR family transcriptional regulator
MAALVAKEYAREFFRLLVMYRDISASEAAARLGLHVKTAQDFLEGLEQAGILAKHEAAEKKRPYFRYSLKKSSLRIELDLKMLYDGDQAATEKHRRIREKKGSGALFKEGRGERITAVHVYEGVGRSRVERRLGMTEPQGRFLYYLPFPTEDPQSVAEICRKAGVPPESLPEILDIVQILASYGVLDISE